MSLNAGTLEQMMENAEMVVTPAYVTADIPAGDYHAEAIAEEQTRIAQLHRDTHLNEQADYAGHTSGRITRAANSERYAALDASTAAATKSGIANQAVAITEQQAYFEENFYYQQPNATYSSYGENAYTPWEYDPNSDNLAEYHENVQSYLSGWGLGDDANLDDAQDAAQGAHDGLSRNENGDIVNADGDILSPAELEAMQAHGEFSSIYETNSPETDANYQLKLDGIDDLQTAIENGEVTSFADLPPQVLQRLESHLVNNGDTLEGKTFADIDPETLNGVVSDFKSETEIMRNNAQNRIDFTDPNLDIGSLLPPPMGGPVVDADPAAADAIAGDPAVTNRTTASADGPAVGTDAEGTPTVAASGDFETAATNTQVAPADVPPAPEYTPPKLNVADPAATGPV